MVGIPFMLNPIGASCHECFGAILHGENTYHDSFTFNPERFLKNGKISPTTQDPEAATFGFGRRAWWVTYDLG